MFTPIGSNLRVADRKLPLMVYAEAEVLEVRIALPKGAAFTEAPSKLVVDAGPFRLEQRAEVTDGTLLWARTLSPRMLWRGGLEAIGPLDVYRYGPSSTLSVDFAQLRNNRIDDAVTNDIRLTLYATHGFGPASSGHTLCSVRVGGLYAGDYRDQPGFDCLPAAVPDGEYTLHLQVEEVNGRVGYSVLSGGDVHFRGGHLDDGYVYVAGGLGPWTLLLLVLSGLMFRRSPS
jgi:hypothetical protein